MKVRLKTSIKFWTHGGRTYRDLNPGDVVEMPEEDARILINANLAEPAESGGGETAPSPPTTSSLTSPPSAPGREGGVEVAPQREGGPVAVPAGGEPPSPAIMVPAEEEKKPLPDPRLIQWLEERGFTKSPNGRLVWNRVDQLPDGRVVRLVVDFEKTPGKGSRYGYELDLRTGEWRTANDLRDSHPLLLQYKAFRDNLLAPKPEAKVARVEEAVKELPAGEGQVLIQKIEAKDEEQIVEELARTDFVSDVLSQYFYCFEHKGRKIVGLSYKGVKQLALRKGNIELKDLELREAKDGYIAIVKARDLERNLEVYGVAYQPYNWPDGTPDNFAVAKVVAKAQRNALRALIPETLITEAYKRWLERREGG
jgi:hypothetical protein